MKEIETSFDRADCVKPALDPHGLDLSPDWDGRAEQWREEEWQTARKLLSTARALLRHVAVRSASDVSLGEIARMLDLASKLGRLSTGLATEKTEISGKDGGPVRIEFRAMLDKVYGEPLPDEAAPPQSSPIGN